MHTRQQPDPYAPATNEEVEAALTAQMLYLVNLEDDDKTLHGTRLGMVYAGIEKVLQMRREARA